MRLPLLPFLSAIIVGVLADIYIYRRLRSDRCSRSLCIAHIAVGIIATIAALWVVVMPKKTVDDAALLGLMWTLFAWLSIYVPKFIIVIFSLFRRLLARLSGRRLRGISIAGIALGTILFGAMWWGALVERRRINVAEVEVAIPSLPEAFDGYRIAQLSDIHTGTWAGNPTFLIRVAETVNSLRPDVVLFTGDIVNRHASELEPFTDALGLISAHDSVWSVMGNHDYGDYSQWPSPQAKQADIARLQTLQRKMGWHMLNNSYTMLRRGTDSLALIGVENIGDPPFHCYGSLGKAYPTPADSVVKILMSHNPAHWTDSIAGNRDINIALTLAGHTHAMQMEMLGWSPASLRYPTWGGLYHDSLGRYLYVNIGLGEVGFPARIGATPEITLITLRKGK